MSYSDQKYFNITPHLVAQNIACGTNTGTASGVTGVVTGTGVLALPQFIKRSKVNAVNVRVDTIPVAGNAGTTLNFLNGTSTFATAAIGTASAGSTVAATIVPANATVAAGSQPTVNVVTTATVSNSGLTCGAYSVYWEVEPLPA